MQYPYDLVGKVAQVNDPTGTYGFSYDNMGRLTGTSTQYSFLTGTFTNSKTYDAASNRTGYTAVVRQNPADGQYRNEGGIVTVRTSEFSTAQ